MPAQKVDLTIEQGADWSHGWLVSVDSALIDPSWEAKSQIRTKYDELLHEFTATVTDQGALVIHVSGAESSPWTWFDAEYDVKIVKDGVTVRVAEGKITLSRAVTHD